MDHRAASSAGDSAFATRMAKTPSWWGMVKLKAAMPRASSPAAATAWGAKGAESRPSRYTNRFPVLTPASVKRSSSVSRNGPGARAAGASSGNLRQGPRLEFVGDGQRKGAGRRRPHPGRSQQHQFYFYGRNHSMRFPQRAELYCLGCCPVKGRAESRARMVRKKQHKINEKHP